MLYVAESHQPMTARWLITCWNITSWFANDWARNNNAPLYLSCLLHNYVSGRSLRYVPASSQSNLLSVPSHKLNFGVCSFRVAAPTVWNSLPADIRACAFYGSFIRQLKPSILIKLFSMLLGPYSDCPRQLQNRVGAYAIQGPIFAKCLATDSPD